MAKKVEGTQKRRLREIPVTDIEAERHGPIQRRPRKEPLQKAQRQVVDGLVACVLERLDRGRAPGAGRPRDKHEPLAGGTGNGRHGSGLSAMGKVVHHGCGKVIRFDAIQQGKAFPKKHDVTSGRQAVLLGLIKVDDEADWRAVEGLCGKDTDKAGLDHAADRFRGAGLHGLCVAPKLRAIIGDKSGSESHQAQGKRGFPAPGGALYENGAPRMRHTGRMNSVEKGRIRRARHRQIGRPTTKRAPSGSDVASASVGRIFSAQITPPCASTICLEIASPRPELLPKSFSGRSE